MGSSTWCKNDVCYTPCSASHKRVPGIIVTDIHLDLVERQHCRSLVGEATRSRVEIMCVCVIGISDAFSVQLLKSAPFLQTMNLGCESGRSSL